MMSFSFINQIKGLKEMDESRDYLELNMVINLGSFL